MDKARLCGWMVTAACFGMVGCGASDSPGGGIRAENGDPNNECGDCWESGEPGENNAFADSAADDGGVVPDDGEELPEIDPGQLTAGRWEDHANWSFWMKLMDSDTNDFRGLVTGWGLHPFERVAVRVVSDGEPVVDQAVELNDGDSQVLWLARTDADGEAFLFPSMLGQQAAQTLEVVVGGVSHTLTDEDDGAVEIELAQASAPADTLDVLFTIDVTGSMLDEQAYLQAEMRDVLEQLEAARPGLDIRVSFNFYCDPSDTFIVDSHPFTDITSGLAVLGEGAECGGGDYEEAVDEGLEDALAHDWSDSARARIVFLVLDAPPHGDDAGRQRLQTFARGAAAEGIKLVPIVSSGANHSLEFLMRSLVIATNGTYTFLTAHSGIGGEKLEPTIGHYEVEYLNELMLDLLLSETE